MREKEQYIYSLRFTVEPGFHESDRLKRLIDFCSLARIDDVMFFINCEELNRGHLPLEETEPWIDMIARTKPELEQFGITTSINPWVTLLHTDRGRALRKGQSFKRMVDPFGSRSQAVVCPLCVEWREYLAGMYAYYAAVKPWVLWVEDDFRLHNHPPLAWGGCFCDVHMEEYSRRAGEKLNREQFVKGIVIPGEPHPFRKIWLETSRDTMAGLARMIGDAVHSVSPDTRVGLMSSSPSVHCAEGRDWNGILRGLAGNNPPVDRVHLPSYEEVLVQEYFWHFNALSRLTEAFLPPATEIYPELENFPYTRYSNSNSFTHFQIESGSAIHPDGITLNIFDMMGNGVKPEEGYAELLSKSKDFLSRVKALDLGGAEKEGVKVPVSPESAFTLYTSQGNSMDELYPLETFWAGFLSALGIANAYSVHKDHAGSIVAVSGQYLRNFEEGELARLFTDNIVLLEGDAAFTLFDMGFGRLIGIEDACWHTPEEHFASYEQVCDGKTYYHLEEARWSAQQEGNDYLEIRYGGEVSVKSIMKNRRGETVGPGIAVSGGRTLIFPYGRFRRRPLVHLNPMLKEILLDFLVSDEKVEHPAYIHDAPYVSLFSYRLTDKTVLLLVNAYNDDYAELRISAPGLTTARILESNRLKPDPFDADYAVNNGVIVLRSGIRAMEVKLLIALQH